MAARFTHTIEPRTTQWPLQQLSQLPRYPLRHNCRGDEGRSPASCRRTGRRTSACSRRRQRRWGVGPARGGGAPRRFDGRIRTVQGVQKLRLDLLRYHKEPLPHLVRHVGMRQPDQGKALPRTQGGGQAIAPQRGAPGDPFVAFIGLIVSRAYRGSCCRLDARRNPRRAQQANDNCLVWIDRHVLRHPDQPNHLSPS